ncbi:cytochrome b [Pararhodobacter zhoushanensis]|uniref:cytochrome b n=1 Tax=Pararhodobacter zhoushanensis TaxID=2479545 RepID=UPI000F8D61B8|nr:cytochrome b/b6 domain-containing protein [Pararhodobacter zhoushanensis]
MPARYHPVLVTLHWLIALLLLMALIAGTLVLDDMPNTAPGKTDALRIHAIMGVGIGVLMLIRLAVRLTTRHPAPAKSGIALADRLAPLAHWALYALVLGMVGSGIAMAVQSGLGDALFGDGTLPETFHTLFARGVHGLLATLLILTIALHILAALYHVSVRRDGLLRRMWFGAR